jgi:CDP-diacylglycerol--serine O-phosphatidyltransferase
MARFTRRRVNPADTKRLRPWNRRAALKGSTLQRDDNDVTMSGEVAARPHPGIYLLPNAFTTAALFSGFFAIVQAMNLQFNTAVIAIFVSMVLDSLDGRVARMTRTQSDFGAEYDSLADMVSFGAAPALVIYEWSLRGLGRWGWVAAFVYVAGAALRLARFNTNIGVVDKRYFQGIPSPAAAALVAGFVWVFDDLRYAGSDLAWPSWIVTVYAGLSMVSNSPFYSFKVVDFKKSVPFIVIVLIMLGFVVVSSDPPKWLFAMFVAYGLSGHLLWVWRKLRRKPDVAGGEPG